MIENSRVVMIKQTYSTSVVEGFGIKNKNKKLIDG